MIEKGATVDIDRMLRSCIHCGLCLNACPTHRLTGDEVESPRGRLLLMRDLLDGAEGDPSPPRDSLDRCLGCLACQSACPSGVRYSELLSASRAQLGTNGSSVAWLIDHVLTRPRWLSLAARLAEPLRGLPLPESLRLLMDSIPRRRRRRRIARTPSRRAPSLGTVAILRGCAQWVFEPDVLDATMELVRAAGFTPVVPAGQGCCGALSHHQGSVDRARELTRQNLRAFEEAEQVLIPSAGCSAFVRELDQLWPAGSTLHAQAADLASKSEDLLPWLLRHGRTLEFRECRERVVYQNACHHRHAQGLVDEGRRLLSRVPGLTVLDCGGEDLCCGSAGSFQLQQPELARRQREEKLAFLLAARPDRILSANPGCEFFLEAGIESGGPVVSHLAVFLAGQLSG